MKGYHCKSNIPLINGISLQITLTVPLTCFLLYLKRNEGRGWQNKHKTGLSGTKPGNISAGSHPNIFKIVFFIAKFKFNFKNSEFKEFEPSLETRLMVGSTWTCIQCFDIWASAKLELDFGGSAKRFKIFKFGLRLYKLTVKCQCLKG